MSGVDIASVGEDRTVTMVMINQPLSDMLQKQLKEYTNNLCGYLTLGASVVLPTLSRDLADEPIIVEGK